MSDDRGAGDTTVAALAHELPCVGCGYDLRGLPQAGNCPECNTPIAQSSHGNLLRNSDPQWLERLRLGASVKIWNIAVAILSTLLAGILVALLSLPPAIIWVIGTVTAVLGLWATFLITTQEPRQSISEQTVTLRRVIRACALGGFLGGFMSGAGPAGVAALILWILAILMRLAGVVAVFGELIYLQRAALRIPDEKLARSTRIVMWGTVGVSTLAILGIVAGAIFGFSTVTKVATTGGLAGDIAVAVFTGGVCVVGIAGLVFMLWYLRLLHQYKRAFAEARDHAHLTQAG